MEKILKLRYTHRTIHNETGLFYNPKTKEFDIVWTDPDGIYTLNDKVIPTKIKRCCASVKVRVELPDDWLYVGKVKRLDINRVAFYHPSLKDDLGGYYTDFLLINIKNNVAYAFSGVICSHTGLSGYADEIDFTQYLLTGSVYKSVIKHEKIRIEKEGVCITFPRKPGIRKELLACLYYRFDSLVYTGNDRRRLGGLYSFVDRTTNKVLIIDNVFNPKYILIKSVHSLEEYEWTFHLYRDQELLKRTGLPYKWKGDTLIIYDKVPVAINNTTSVYGDEYMLWNRTWVNSISLIESIDKELIDDLEDYAKKLMSSGSNETTEDIEEIEEITED